MDYELRKNIVHAEEDPSALLRAANELLRKGEFESLANLILKYKNTFDFLDYITKISGAISYDEVEGIEGRFIFREIHFKNKPGIVLFLIYKNNIKKLLKKIVKDPRKKSALVDEIKRVLRGYKADLLLYKASLKSLYITIANSRCKIHIFWPWRCNCVPDVTVPSILELGSNTDQFHLVDIISVEVNEIINRRGRRSMLPYRGALSFLNLRKLLDFSDSAYDCAVASFFSTVREKKMTNQTDNDKDLAMPK